MRWLALALLVACLPRADEQASTSSSARAASPAPASTEPVFAPVQGNEQFVQHNAPPPCAYLVRESLETKRWVRLADARVDPKWHCASDYKTLASEIAPAGELKNVLVYYVEGDRYDAANNISLRLTAQSAAHFKASLAELQTLADRIHQAHFGAPLSKPLADAIAAARPAEEKRGTAVVTVEREKMAEEPWFQLRFRIKTP